MAEPVSPLRIAVVHPFHWHDVPRGGERYVADLAWWLARQGHAVDVITGTDGEPGTEIVDGATIRRVRHVLGRAILGHSMARADSFGIAVHRALRRGSWDVVHAMTPTAALSARAARHRTLLTVMGQPTPEQYAGRAANRLITGQAVRRASGVAAFSQPAAQQVEAMFGRVCDVLPLGVRLEAFRPNLEPRVGPPRLLFAGAPDVERKGLAVALAAMPAILDARPDARLVVPGDREVVRRHAQAVGCEQTEVLAAVDALGQQPMSAMAEIYRGATISVLPARWEALGISLVESLACGTPIVCWDEAGPPTIVGNHDVGVVAPVGRVDALARAMLDAIKLAAHPQTPQRCHDRARAWDWDLVVGPAHDCHYRDLVNRSAGRPPTGRRDRRRRGLAGRR
jgi:phosphatidylinositol alpha-mannosyltransferase